MIMLKISRKFPGLLLLVALSMSVGCSSGRLGQLKQPTMTADMALLYLYRPSSMANVVVSPQLQVDDMDGFSIGSDSYTYVQLKPGYHRVRLLLAARYQGEHEFSFQAAAGQTYYLRVDAQMKFRKNDLYDRRFDLQAVAAAAARDEIAQCDFFMSQAEAAVQVQADDAGSKPETPADAQFSISKSRDPFARSR